MPLKRKTSLLYNFLGTRVTFLKTALSVSCIFSDRRKRKGGYVFHILVYVNSVFIVAQWATSEFSFVKFIWFYNLACLSEGWLSRKNLLCLRLLTHTSRQLVKQTQQAFVFLMFQCRNPCWSGLFFSFWIQNEWWKSLLCPSSLPSYWELFCKI